MTDLTILKGVGPKTLTLFEKLDIKNLNDLVTYYPYRYNFIELTDLKDGEVVVNAQIIGSPVLYRIRGNLNKMTFTVSLKDNIVKVVIFNRAFLKNQLKDAKKVLLVGKYNSMKTLLIASDIKLFELKKPQIEPIYHTTKGISNNSLNNFINMGINIYQDEVVDDLPSYIVDKYNFIDKLKTIKRIHNPSNKNELEKAILRAKYEELFYFALKINYLKSHKENEGIAKKLDIKKLNELIASLPFKLSKDQEKTLSEIKKDFTEEKRMNRLLQGEVGSGKTIVAFISIYMNYLAGYQSAFMAPTEVLANQHYDNALKLFKDELKVEILTSSTKKKERNKILTKLKNGEINLLIGTHSLIFDEVIFDNLAFIITDEQHRFGVRQRALLNEKGIKPDVLYLTATPIPRTYALSLFADLDISSIKTMPKNRLPVKTYLKSSKDLNFVSNLMYEQLKSGHQIYVVAPLIEESDKSNMVDIKKLYERISKTFSPKYKVDIIHGKMKNMDKEKLMEDFKKNRTQILVSTTVIEVGVDVPSATLMVIFDAHRFGLATLHQLRGRVGRSNLQSYCVLVSDLEKERLKIMEKINSGFKISEEDFKIRGHGDLFGFRQSGDMRLGLADFKEDFDLYLKAFDDAKDYIKNNEESKLLSKLVKSLKKID